MRHIISKTFLLTMILTASIHALRAQDAYELLSSGEQPGLLTDGMTGLGSLQPIGDLLSPGDDLAIEGAPDTGGSIPVDGGLSLLLAAGAAYGAGRLRRKACRPNDGIPCAVTDSHERE